MKTLTKKNLLTLDDPIIPLICTLINLLLQGISIWGSSLDLAGIMYFTFSSWRSSAILLAFLSAAQLIIFHFVHSNMFNLSRNWPTPLKNWWSQVVTDLSGWILFKPIEVFCASFSELLKLHTEYRYTSVIVFLTWLTQLLSQRIAPSKDLHLANYTWAGENRYSYKKYCLDQC